MQRETAVLYRNVVLGVLVILVSLNTAWFLVSKHSGSLWGFILYLIILFLCWRQNEFRAGIAAGLLGFGVHLYELVNADVEDLIFIDLLFSLLNLVLPILLVYSSYQAYKTSK